jgi:hypothetical protein
MDDVQQLAEGREAPWSVAAHNRLGTSHRHQPHQSEGCLANLTRVVCGGRACVEDNRPSLWLCVIKITIFQPLRDLFHTLRELRTSSRTYIMRCVENRDRVWRKVNSMPNVNVSGVNRSRPLGIIPFVRAVRRTPPDIICAGHWLISSGRLFVRGRLCRLRRPKSQSESA